MYPISGRVCTHPHFQSLSPGILPRIDSSDQHQSVFFPQKDQIVIGYSSYYLKVALSIGSIVVDWSIPRYQVAARYT